MKPLPWVRKLIFWISQIAHSYTINWQNSTLWAVSLLLEISLGRTQRRMQQLHKWACEIEMQICKPQVANAHITRSLRLCLFLCDVCCHAYTFTCFASLPRRFSSKRETALSLSKQQKLAPLPLRLLNISHFWTVFENHPHWDGYIRRTYSMSAHWNFYSACWIWDGT